MATSRPVSIAFFLLAIALLSGCKKSDSAAENVSDPNKRPQIVATTGMVGDLVRGIVGEAADVTVLMGPGVDPHLHQPSRSDAVALSQADIVIYNGLHLEGQLGEVLESRTSRGGQTIAVGEMLPKDQLLDADGSWHDPHIWMDVKLWADTITPLTEKLSKALPEHAATFQASAEAYREELLELDRWAAACLESIPKKQRVLITAHDAFRYFGRRYDVEVYGVQGVSTTSEAGITDVNRLVNLIVERDVKAVFFESSVSPRQVKAIVHGANSRDKEVSSDHVLYSDSMGPADSNADTYIGMIRHNTRTITEALGGTVVDIPTSTAPVPSAS